MASGSADIAAGAKVSDFTRLPLSPPVFPHFILPYLARAVSACQYASICLMGPSEELTADTLVSLFPAAILLEAASVISHAAGKPSGLRHLRRPLSSPPHRSASLQERKP